MYFSKPMISARSKLESANLQYTCLSVYTMVYGIPRSASISISGFKRISKVRWLVKYPRFFSLPVLKHVLVLPGQNDDYMAPGVHAIFVLDEIVQRYKRMNRRGRTFKGIFGRLVPSLALIPFDLDKAFDKQNRQKIWENLRHALQCIQIELTIQEMYQATECILTASSGEVRRLIVPLCDAHYR